MRFVFRKKRYKHEKSIDDLKKSMIRTENIGT